MKQLFEEDFIYENLLLAYYSDKPQTLNVLWNDKVTRIIEVFLEIWENEDRQKGTNHIKLIQTIYANPRFKDRAEYLKSLHISNSTLQRYREKYSLTLKLVIERLSDSS